MLPAAVVMLASAQIAVQGGLVTAGPHERQDVAWLLSAFAPPEPPAKPHRLSLGPLSQMPPASFVAAAVGGSPGHRSYFANPDQNRPESHHCCLSFVVGSAFELAQPQRER